MGDILKQLRPTQPTDVYTYGNVVSVGSGGIIKIKTTTGVELSVRDTKQTYFVGDRVILGTDDKKLSNVFIIRKVDKIHQTSITLTISMGQG
jgi:hypothetical protein